MFPRKFLQRLDEAKGPYYSRNKYILKILEEHLNENELKNNLRGSEGTTPPTQAAVEVVATTPTQTTTVTSNPKANQSLRDTVTYGARRTTASGGDVASNEKY
jgi:hypothetical protein